METMIHRSDLARYHHAIKLIEVDGEEGYFTCRGKYGAELANVLLIAHLRRRHGSEIGYPPEGGYERVVEDTNTTLEELGFFPKQS